MITIYSDQHTLHDAPHEFVDGRLDPPHESPRRADMILAALAQAAYGPIVGPREFGRAPVAAVHDAGYLDYLEHAYERWVAAKGAPAALLGSTLAVRWMGRRSDAPLAAPGYYCFDLSAPIVAGTYRAARDSADAALTAAALLLQGQRSAYALCRPPGHHAGSDMCGGYCFLNNAAIAATYLLAQANQPTEHASAAAPRVAILDIDYHHGNGTQQIFYQRADVLTVSLHADPAREYPYFAGNADEQGAGAGTGYNLNIPLEAGIDDERYLSALEGALEAIAVYAPQFLVVAAGFDTFCGDPIGDFAMTTAAHPPGGQRIAALGLPTLFVQEGGYAVEALGANAVGLLRGFVEGAH